ncbi:Dyp-type peroxidase [Auraticoccus sp. F435]|uniref:Dyp-type peroxidase n=1 Tax=Auraticoccus cholistanensis TaxID=2656650 RepID=A0A6A9V0R4_9ACTN|nr:Dyp-type peroxidase [Auraticoccus cholistanensis]MVA76089.1 Dyp-type peroxidase [Auraticoccus cholistanensis]
MGSADRPGAVRPGLGRRALLTGGAAAGAVGAFAVGRLSREGGQQPSALPEPVPAEPLSSYGRHQLGVSEPLVRQAHIGVTVADLTGGRDVTTVLAALGSRIERLTTGVDPQLAGVDPAGLTVTVGVGPDVVAEARGPGSPGAADLPRFAREDVEEQQRGGDLLLQVCSDDPTVIVLAEQALLAELADDVRVRWQVAGFRGALDGIGARNLLGFHDGISVPKTPADQEQLVWLDEPEDLAGASIAVVRLMPIRVEDFVALPVQEQEARIGRRRDSGIPLSGGSIDDDPDLQAKSEAGVYDIPVDAHVRRAHPLPAGLAGLMLRRSYSYARSASDKGLIFISFQRELETFSRTLARMDEQDALLEFTRTTASGTFLILPGYSAEWPLGATLVRAG